MDIKELIEIALKSNGGEFKIKVEENPPTYLVFKYLRVLEEDIESV
jgi:hypothetical protein